MALVLTLQYARHPDARVPTQSAEGGVEVNLSPGRSAWDYGTPQEPTEQVAATLRECILSDPDGQVFELAGSGSRVVIDNLAASIVHDLLTSGALSPSIPDVPPPDRAQP